MSSAQAPTKNLALDLVRVTESAALSAARYLGKGDKNGGDKAAVDAMRQSFNQIDIEGRIVIGEGEKDEAPMLYCGEIVGTGRGEKLDVAVDPVEGTNLLALGRPNSIAVISLAPRGCMYDPGPAYYMKKLVVGAEARDVVDLNASTEDNLRRIAKAKRKEPNDLIIFVLDKPRHKQLIEEIRAVGARIQLHTDGDVAGALMAVSPQSEVDVMMGTGGTPEGVLAATAIKILGGEILSKLDPQSEEERKTLLDAGYDIDRVLGVDDLITSNDIFFAATGITGGSFLDGVRFTPNGAVTYSMVMRGLTGTVRFIEAQHNFDQLMKISNIPYA